MKPAGLIRLFVSSLAVWQKRNVEKVLAKRKEVNNVTYRDLGMSSDSDATISHLAVYDHLTPRLQQLLFEQGLEGYFWDPGFDQNTVRDSGKRKIS